jgi:hypothetical protein
MEIRLVFTLLSGIMAYILTALLNLFSQKPLPVVLVNSLFALVAVSVSCWLILTLLKYLSEKMAQEKNRFEGRGNDDNRESEISSAKGEEKTGDTKGTKQGENNFSPMDPTVLEVEDENN